MSYILYSPWMPVSKTIYSFLFWRWNPFNISILCKKNSNKYCQKIASIVLQTKHETLPYWQLELKTIIWKFLEYSLPCLNRLIFRFPYKWKMGKYIWQRGWSLYNLEVVFANVYYVYMHKDVNIYYSSNNDGSISIFCSKNIFVYNKW